VFLTTLNIRHILLATAPLAGDHGAVQRADGARLRHSGRLADESLTVVLASFFD
jgi:hypothetical protein